jgi:hypothetical protein
MFFSDVSILRLVMPNFFSGIPIYISDLEYYFSDIPIITLVTFKYYILGNAILQRIRFL